MSRPRKPFRGWFISIEGPDGAGKTTQATALAGHLRANGVDVLTTREPGGTELGERIRDVLLARTTSEAPIDPLTEALLFNAARRQLVTEVIRPALESGQTVLCTRFADSTLAYQGFGGGVTLERLMAIEAVATDGLRPDLTIVLDLPAEKGLARKASDDMTRFETEFDLAFHQRVRAGFLALAAAEPARFVIVDGSRPAENVAGALAAITDRLIGGSEPNRAAIRTHS